MLLNLRRLRYTNVLFFENYIRQGKTASKKTAHKPKDFRSAGTGKQVPNFRGSREKVKHERG